MTQGKHIQVRENDDSMQMPDSYVGADEHLELPRGKERTQVLEQILSTGMTSFHKQGYRLLGNAADAEDAVQYPLLAAYTHLDQFRGQSQNSTWLTNTHSYPALDDRDDALPRPAKSACGTTTQRRRAARFRYTC